MSVDWTSLLLALTNLLTGGGWLLDRRKRRQEAEGIRADNRQKEMDLAKSYVDEFKENIAEPLRKEVGGLRREIKNLKNAIQKINDCPHADGCPVYCELQRQQERERAEAHDQ